MRTITEKYFISFSGLDTELSAQMQISKKEFQRQMIFLQGQVGTPVIDDLVVEYRSHLDDVGNVWQIRHYYTTGTAETELVEMHCKEGYCFK